tara:strand:+ start:387 stop:677 length:291 start_codon:yes stop_codon:yes gene_type:complete
MYKQNRGLMTNQTKQTKDYMTQEDHEAYDRELEKHDLQQMVECLATDYAEMHNDAAYEPVKEILNQLLMYGEGEGVLVKTAITQLWTTHQEQKEGR